MTTPRIPFKCPKCGAPPNEHGKGGAEACKRPRPGTACLGFICECDEGGEDHGESYANPCLEATCWHCDWSGKFPKPPGKLKAWQKTALAAGWTPPDGFGT